MTRELKLALIVGFSLVLVVMVLVSDHLSKARKTELAPPANEVALAPKLNVQPEILAPLGTAPADPLASSGSGGSSGTSIEDQTLDLKRAADRLGVATRDGNSSGMISIAPTLSETNMTPPAPYAVNPMGSAPSGVTPMGLENVNSSNTLGNGAGSSTTSLNTGTTLPGTAIAANEKVHVIAEGQSLYSIAKQYYGNGKYWKQLLDYNKATIKSENSLKLGAKVRVPELAVLTGKPSEIKPVIDPVKPQESVVTKADSKATTKPHTYVVQKGDTPAAIAKKQLGSSRKARELMEKNKIQDEGGLKIGMVLQLPD